MMDAPKVSIIMSVYNCEQYLQYSIDSIINQSFKDFEFIIIDDGSTDNSLRIIEEYQVKDGRILLINNKNNCGLAASLNRGIKIARSKFIARQDADDISEIDRLKLQYNFMKNNKTVDVLGSNCSYIDLNNRHIFYDDHFSKIKQFKDNLLKAGAILPHGSAFMRASVIKDFDGYNESFYYSQDGELWLRLLDNNRKIFILPQFLYQYRLQPISGKSKYGHSEYNKLKNKIYNGKTNSKVKKENFIALSKNIKEKITSYNTSKNSDSLSDYWLRIGKLFILKSQNKKYAFSCLRLSTINKGSIINLHKIGFWIFINLLSRSILHKIKIF